MEKSLFFKVFKSKYFISFFLYEDSANFGQKMEEEEDKLENEKKIECFSRKEN